MKKVALILIISAVVVGSLFAASGKNKYYTEITSSKFSNTMLTKNDKILLVSILSSFRWNKT